MVDPRDRDPAVAIDVVRPPLNHVAVEMELANFINDFLFARGPDPDSAPPSHALSPRHQRPPRNKRYRGMWRFAARSLIKKRCVPEDILPPINADQLHLLPKSQLRRKLPSKILLDNCELGRSDDAQQQSSSIKIDVVSTIPSSDDVKDEAAPQILQTTADSSCAMVGTDVKSAFYGRAQAPEANSTHAIPKHSCRKPPRPPRANMSRSSSYRAIRLKTAARRATLENARMRRRKMHTSTSNASSVWALIITFCFVSIMLVQGLLGNNFKGTNSIAEGQPSFTLNENDSSLSPDREMPPKSSTQNFLSQRGPGLSFSYMHWVQQSGPEDSQLMVQGPQKKRAQVTSNHAGFAL